ncbi:hypothetical protein BDY19DRAFT_906789 [Irpex rosettiformis]|uniref:Uncharacterized protein n=1 Tax=Irpex rosettiformis TaxID=378272 RepID=A0ACB8U2I0_9APHY|nr:hypothetical protein BDY19DRAFT_906789 [Irpex rosettiformis]
MDSTEVGRYGTLRLMKRLEPHKVVASYPIDEEEVTFGRDTSCSIRLYYESVSSLHCKIIFRDRKAFLVVLGTNGLLIDGCPVFPATTSSGNPVTVPLPNNSSIEINKKSFQFSYPPKEIRQALLDTPGPAEMTTPDKKRRRRTLRMSMIQSAQVFTPRPSQDPRENLRILKTPIKTPFSASKSLGMSARRRRESSPLKRGAYVPPLLEESDEDEDDDEERDIVLVESNHPKVVEEDRDLVILELVTVEVPEPQPEPPQRTMQFPLPENAQPQVPQTPQRRRGGQRASLHRAVLIRSAQRMAMRAEMEDEEDEDREAEEVEETIQALEGLKEEADEEDEEDDGKLYDEHAGDGEEMDVKQQQSEQEEEKPMQRSTPLSGWRKSFGLVAGWAMGSPVKQGQEETQKNEGELAEDKKTPVHESNEQEDSSSMDIVRDLPAPRRITTQPSKSPRPPTKSPRRQHQPLGNFMTPQVPHAGRSSRHVRYSVGGFTPGGIHGASIAHPLQALPISGAATHTGARRVRIVEPWKVEDIVIPTAGGVDDDGDEGEQDGGEGEWEDEEEGDREGERDEYEYERGVSMSVSPSKKPAVSAEERKAIMERRRSALTAPDTFFGGQVPGSRRMSLFASPLKSPAKQPPTSTATPRRIPAPLFTADSSSSDINPFAPPPSSSSALPEAELGFAATLEVEDEHLEEDAQVLLAKMKQTVENVKRRQSLGRPPLGLGMGVAPSPRKGSANGFSLLAPDAGSTPARRIEVGGSREEEMVEGSEEEDKENENENENENEHENEVLEEAYEDVEMDVEDVPHREDQEQTQEEAIPPEQPTPSFKGIRELFSSRAPMATPRMDGIRELYRTERVLATPAFDGLGEMLETPAGWAEEVDEPSEKSDLPPIAEPEQQKKPATKMLARRVPTTRLPSGPALAKAPLRRPISRTVSGGLRITPVNKTDPAASTSSTGSTGRESEASTSKATRGPLKATTSAGARVVARKAKAKIVEPEPEPEKEVVQVHEKDMEDAEPEAPKPVRRTTRKTSASPAPEQPTRRSTRKTPTPQPEEVPVAKTTSGPRRRAKTPTLPEVEEENAEEDGEKAGAKVKKNARGRSTMKDEDEDDSDALSDNQETVPRARTTTTGRALRGRKPAGSAGTTSGIPRSTSTSRVRATTASSTAKKTTTTTTAGTSAAAKAKGASDRPAVTGDKENTPERQTALEDDNPATQKSTAASGSKTKVATRSGGRTRAASADVDTGDKVATGARVSRAKARK